MKKIVLRQQADGRYDVRVFVNRKVVLHYANESMADALQVAEFAASWPLDFLQAIAA